MVHEKFINCGYTTNSSQITLRIVIFSIKNRCMDFNQYVSLLSRYYTNIYHYAMLCIL